ncbi:type VII secretion system-associated protein [Streptomyces mutabilis]|uniref:Type VII secretion system-associated protein n=1 Tax=Streptomyces mutabilis TaxID=67332 RepID=A0A086MVC7_9ACTN|nr:type VII secretion system-associated protein [Streptomyces mutabilis]KFG72845.1 hypothetical protein FM21_18405 [Streptomyces mutabilis]
MRPEERQEGSLGARPEAPVGSGPAAVPGASPADATEAVGTPEIPEAVRAAARRAPGHWIGVVDPEWTRERTPPEWAVLGEWQSDENGRVGVYRPNPAYRPSARVLGWPEPTDPVDEAAQRAATGYGSVDEALEVLAAAEVAVVRGLDGGPLTAAGRDGAPVALLFTSSAHEFTSAALRHDRIPARELARSLSGTGTMLMVNAGAAAPLLVPADSLLGPGNEPGAEEAAAGAAVVETPGPTSGGVADRAGPPAAGPAPGQRADEFPQSWPHTAGRTP